MSEWVEWEAALGDELDGRGFAACDDPTRHLNCGDNE
jgi:hypothetical protein